VVPILGEENVMKRFALSSIGIALLALAGCQQPQTRVEAAGPEAAGGGAGAPAASAPAPPPEEIAIPQGTALRVRLAQTVDTQRNRPGDRFQATLDVPLLSGNRVIVPQGTAFYGQVVQAKPSGRFKGHAVLALRLDARFHFIDAKLFRYRVRRAGVVAGKHDDLDAKLVQMPNGIRARLITA
jgi:hypothetical protein